MGTTYCYFLRAVEIFMDLFVAINPAAMAIIVASLAVYHSQREQRVMVNSALRLALVLLLLFSICGNGILKFLGINLLSIEFACGIIFFCIGFRVLNSDGDGEQAEPGRRSDLSVIPLAIPCIAGPRALAIAMEKVPPCLSLARCVAIVIVCAAVFLFFRGALWLMGRVNATFAGLFHRLCGLIILSIAIQHILHGLEHSLFAGYFLR
jgi:multiple antibiotic resistance protein